MPLWTKIERESYILARESRTIVHKNNHLIYRRSHSQGYHNLEVDIQEQPQPARQAQGD